MQFSTREQLLIEAAYFVLRRMEGSKEQVNEQAMRSRQRKSRRKKPQGIAGSEDEDAIDENPALQEAAEDKPPQSSRVNQIFRSLGVPRGQLRRQLKGVMLGLTAKSYKEQRESEQSQLNQLQIEHRQALLKVRLLQLQRKPTNPNLPTLTQPQPLPSPLPKPSAISNIEEEISSRPNPPVLSLDAQPPPQENKEEVQEVSEPVEEEWEDSEEKERREAEEYIRSQNPFLVSLKKYQCIRDVPSRPQRMEIQGEEREYRFPESPPRRVPGWAREGFFDHLSQSERKRKFFQSLTQ